MDLARLPADLPEPVDDGACRHLAGLAVPELELASTEGGLWSLRNATTRFVVLYIYPRTGGPGITMPADWDLIPGARGCTPQACAFRDYHAELAALDATVVGVSAQPLAEQREFAARMHIPFPLLNDSELTLTEPPLSLPTFTVEGVTLYKRVTLVTDAGIIKKVYYPVFPPDQNAAAVITYLASHVS